MVMSQNNNINNSESAETQIHEITPHCEAFLHQLIFHHFFYEALRAQLTHSEQAHIAKYYSTFSKIQCDCKERIPSNARETATVTTSDSDSNGMKGGDSETPCVNQELGCPVCLSKSDLVGEFVKVRNLESLGLKFIESDLTTTGAVDSNTTTATLTSAKVANTTQEKLLKPEHPFAIPARLGISTAAHFLEVVRINNMQWVLALIIPMLFPKPS